MVASYQVLARKYRPQTLSELVGQDILVQTLSRALRTQTLPHAFVLHGIRGVGKTTTARLIAKAVNCTGPLSADKLPPCSQCSSCLSVTEDRHLDVIEMDAASRTGVDDIREVIEAARYKAVHGLYKVYIIDEVHMLSKSAFNALLKTLEEPPPHVKFIFATTEIKKIPDTVLSRCMRFDLKRLSLENLKDLLSKVCGQESWEAESKALSLLAHAADGSARDALSLLDQAVTLKSLPVTLKTVQEMLGLLDRTLLRRLTHSLFSGELVSTLTQVRDLYRLGADPLTILSDLLDVTYSITCAALNSALAENDLWEGEDPATEKALSSLLSLEALSRLWQVLSKGYEEITRSPLPRQSLEMVLVRAHLMRSFSSGQALQSPDPLSGQSSGSAQGASHNTAPSSPLISSSPALLPGDPSSVTPSEGSALETFEALLSVVAAAREPLLYSHLIQDVHCVRVSPGSVEIRPTHRAPKQLDRLLKEVLERATSRSWTVHLSQEKGEQTVQDQRQQTATAQKEHALNHPLVREILQTFPGTTPFFEPLSSPPPLFPQGDQPS